MNLEININEYLLGWYLLYGASLSKEIDKFRKSLWNKYKIEYNACYKDKAEIIKYGKDFIPDNDVLYNEIFKSEIYAPLKRETNRHKMQLVRIFKDLKNVKNYFNEVTKLSIKETINLYVLHPRMEIVEYYGNNTIIWGSERDKYASLKLLITTILKANIDEYTDNKEIVNAILELAGINEIGKRLGNLDAYNDGNPSLKLIKRQIYPFFLMYLGYDNKEEILDRMVEDKIGFDLDKYPIDKHMKRMDLQDFIKFCVKNSKHILKLSNVLEIEKEDEIEVI